MINFDALQAGSKEATLEAAKLIPGIGILIEGVRKYHEHIEEEQKAELMIQLYERIDKIEKEGFTFNKEWYHTAEGKIVTKKIIATALNAEYADKIKYFVNALFNASDIELDLSNKNKFIEILRNISLPALDVLAVEKNLHKKRGSMYSPQVLPEEIVQESKMDPHLVEACVKELYNLGVFSSTITFNEYGRKNSGYDNGTPAYTGYTDKFIKFIQEQ